MFAKKAVLLLVGSLPVLPQGFGQREMMQLWMQGRFREAELNFARVEPGTGPALLEYFLSWRADYEIERARYSLAAELLEQAKRFRTENSERQRLLEKRLARLYLAVGQFSQAERAALLGSRWKGDDVRKLDLPDTNLVTLGEVYLARGKFPVAIQIFEKASAQAKKSWKTDSPDWIRAQSDIAFAELGLGQIDAAFKAATQALSEAEHEWGPSGLPRLDAMDALGVVRVYQSNFTEARRLLAQSLMMRELLYGSEHPKVSASYLHSAMLHSAEKDNTGAVRLINQSMQIERAMAPGGPNGRWALALLESAEVYAKVGQIDDAKKCYAIAIPLLEGELGVDAPRLQDARKRHAELAARLTRASQSRIGTGFGDRDQRCSRFEPEVAARTSYGRFGFPGSRAIRSYRGWAYRTCAKRIPFRRESCAVELRLEGFRSPFETAVIDSLLS